METTPDGDAAVEEGDRVPIGESSFNECRAREEGSAEYKNTFRLSLAKEWNYASIGYCG
jgi:hypothetical protein